MSLAALTWALYGEHGDLDPTARLVLVVLADHAGTEHVAWPSRHTMAAAAGCSVDTVDRRLRELVDADLIERVEPDDLPAAWQQLPANRRPRAYRIGGGQGPQPAAPEPRQGPQTDDQGPQNRPLGAAAVRHKPKEPNLEPTRARARETGRPDTLRPCPRCRHLHRADEPCLRRQPADVAARGAAAARAALAERLAVSGMVASMSRRDVVVDRDGDWYLRHYSGEPAEPCAVCGTHARAPGFRWLHRTGVVCCGRCRFTVHALAVGSRRGARRPPALREPLPELDDEQLPL